MKRRNFLTAAAALPILAATPLVAATSTEAAQVLDAPENLDPDVFAAGLLGSAGIIEHMLLRHRPADSTIKGFQFMCRDGELDHSTIWATAITDDYRLIHVRPAVHNDWRAKSDG